MIVIVNGKMRKDGEPYLPCMEDGQASEALRASQRARSMSLEVTSGKEGRLHHVSLAFNCAYCMDRHWGVAANPNAAIARVLAEQKLYGVNEESGELDSLECKCGAIYHREKWGRVYQVNL